jgi:hypothetical protein
VDQGKVPLSARHPYCNNRAASDTTWPGNFEQATLGSGQGATGRGMGQTAYISCHAISFLFLEGLDFRSSMLLLSSCWTFDFIY